MFKKELILLVGVGLLGLSYLLEFVAGPVSINLSTPLGFVEASFLGRYPLTAVAVITRALSVVIGIVLSLSMLKYRFFEKAIGVLVVAILFELYAIQQLATSGTVTTVEWTLALAIAAVGLILSVVYYVIRGFVYIVVGDAGVKVPKSRQDTAEPREFELE